MRLPQSPAQPLFRVSFAFLLTAFVAVFSFGAQAATQQLTCSPSSLNFGVVPIGQTETQLVTLTNSGSTTVKVTAMNLSGTQYSMSQMTLPLTLSAGESSTVAVTFSPTTTGWLGAQSSFTSNASNSSLLLELAGSGVTSDTATASPSSLAFGQVAVGSSSEHTITLTNDRSWKIKLAGFQTTGSAFSVSAPATPLTLDPGQSVTVNVTFTPPAAGTATGSLFVSGPRLNVPFSGTGTTTSTSGQLTVTPATVNFGNVPVGTTQTQSITLGASGASVTISSDSVSSAQFVLQGLTLPLTIPAGQSASFNVAFTPASSGTQTGSVSFSSNASNSKTTESVTGDGTTVQYSVGLSWNATSGVSGYNVYRSTSASGTYAKINPNLSANTAYTDSTVASGQTYYYAATSVNSSGVESSRSTPVEAVVP